MAGRSAVGNENLARATKGGPGRAPDERWKRCRHPPARGLNAGGESRDMDPPPCPIEGHIEPAHHAVAVGLHQGVAQGRAVSHRSDRP